MEQMRNKAGENYLYIVIDETPAPSGHIYFGHKLIGVIES